MVLTRIKIAALLKIADPNYKLLIQLMVCSGLQLMEAVRLRLHDIDYDYLPVLVWQGKDNKNRRLNLAPAG